VVEEKEQSGDGIAAKMRESLSVGCGTMRIAFRPWYQTICLKMRHITAQMGYGLFNPGANWRGV
jgi:hypothetical protein